MKASDGMHWAKDMSKLGYCLAAHWVVLTHDTIPIIRRVVLLYRRPIIALADG